MHTHRCATRLTRATKLIITLRRKEQKGLNHPREDLSTREASSSPYLVGSGVRQEQELFSSVLFPSAKFMPHQIKRA